MNKLHKTIRTGLITIATLAWGGAMASHIVEGMVYAEQDAYAEWVCDKVRRTLLNSRGKNEVSPDMLSTGYFGHDATSCVVTTHYVHTGEPLVVEGVMTKHGLSLTKLGEDDVK